jgi:hypothetical protein
MRIICLTGISNTGKTTTLNLLYHLLVPDLATSRNDREVLGNPIQNDFWETVDYKQEVIEFYTMGDYPKALELAIREAPDRDVTVFICACSGFSERLINELRRYRTAFVPKTISVMEEQQGVFNQSDARILLNMI